MIYTELVMNDWFAHCHTLDEARLEYRRLCFEHHPDHGGDTLVMQAINAAYEQFKRNWDAPHRQQNRSRGAWGSSNTPRTSTSRPRSAPTSTYATHSREYVGSVWKHSPWQQLANGGRARSLLGHTVALVQHPSRKFEGAWFVVVDGVFSSYFYYTLADAEQAAFDLLYDKVKQYEI